jgi:hypothetical protein
MSIEILVPIGLFVLGMVVSHTLSAYGVRILEQQRKR